MGVCGCVGVGVCVCVSLSLSLSVCVCVSLSLSLSVCVCVCARARARVLVWVLCQATCQAHAGITVAHNAAGGHTENQLTRTSSRTLPACRTSASVAMRPPISPTMGSTTSNSATVAAVRAA